MTEIKPPYDELDTILNEYVDNYEFNFDEGSHTPTEFEMTLIKDAIYGLLADTDWDNAWGRHIAELAKVEQGKPVAYIWHDHMGTGSKSLRFSKPSQWDYTNAVESLFTHPVRPMSDADIVWIYEEVSHQELRPQDKRIVFEVARAIEAHIKGATE